MTPKSIGGSEQSTKNDAQIEADLAPKREDLEAFFFCKVNANSSPSQHRVASHGHDDILNGLDTLKIRDVEHRSSIATQARSLIVLREISQF